jgi:hypothetical protein
VSIIASLQMGKLVAGELGVQKKLQIKGVLLPSIASMRLHHYTSAIKQS